jgi:hypothetical protein
VGDWIGARRARVERQLDRLGQVLDDLEAKDHDQ